MNSPLIGGIHIDRETGQAVANNPAARVLEMPESPSMQGVAAVATGSDGALERLLLLAEKWQEKSRTSALDAQWHKNNPSSVWANSRAVAEYELTSLIYKSAAMELRRELALSIHRQPHQNA